MNRNPIPCPRALVSALFLAAAAAAVLLVPQVVLARGPLGPPFTPASPPCFSDSNRYADCGNGTVTDGVTGLTWLKDAYCLGSLTWKDANDAAASLGDGTVLACNLHDNSIPGQWRLPTKDELQAIADQATTNGCVSPGPYVPDTNGLGCWTEGNPFSRLQSYSYWSATTDVADPTLGWITDLSIGVAELGYKAHTYYVWPVRGGP